MKYLRTRFDYVDKTNQIMYQRLAKIHLRTVLQSSGHPHVYMKVYHGQVLVGQVRPSPQRQRDDPCAFGSLARAETMARRSTCA